MGLLYFDRRWTSLMMQAVRKDIPILIDAERVREGTDELLELSDYVVCSVNFPQAS